MPREAWAALQLFASLVLAFVAVAAPAEPRWGIIIAAGVSGILWSAAWYNLCPSPPSRE